MSRMFALALVFLAMPGSVAAADAVAAPAPAAHYTTTETMLGTLLDDPAAKAVLEKYIPTLIKNEQIDMARGMTLKLLQSYVAESLTDDTLAKIDADLAKLPAK